MEIIKTNILDKIQTKEQKEFNKLIKMIESIDKSLAKYELKVAKFENFFNNECILKVNEYLSCITKYLLLLDKAYNDNILLNRLQKKFLAEHIVVIISGYQNKNEDLLRLYKIYVSDDEALTKQNISFEKQKNSYASAIEEAFGCKVDKEFFNIDNIKDLLKHIQKNMENYFGIKNESNNVENDSENSSDKESVSNTMKEVYRKLVQDLHPDRETNEAERIRKTELMKQINKAYETENFLMLIKIHSEINNGNTDNFNTEKIKSYNKMLKNQIYKFNAKVKLSQVIFGAQYNLSKEDAKNPIKGIKSLKSLLDELKLSIVDTNSKIDKFSNPIEIKYWLNECIKFSRK